MTKNDILKYLKKQREEFRDRYNIEEIGLFGSYARDEATEQSDIDIFIKAEPTLHNIIGVKQKIEEDLNKKIDLVRVREKMNKYLKNRILKEGVYVR